MSDDSAPAEVLFFPLASGTEVSTRTENGVPVLVIVAAGVELRFHTDDPYTVTRSDLEMAAVLHAAVQGYFDGCQRYLAAREAFGGWPGQDEPIPPTV
ncbi:hypothetical protein [Crossiella cryophila]|uniref:Uncharacterized protein n=1 Tax=Crossiella cryophila TaxID=43355 RepID=A0A7W7G038_9PSEU|nr:hypothetical protein [Crossiella cryophila]MBB4681804.1 hypothetical protein [Crossiella cryophila]